MEIESCVKIERIEAFRTSDGIIFVKEKLAVDHQREIIFAKWYHNNKLQDVLLPDVLGWLKNHATTLNCFLCTYINEDLITKTEWKP